MYEDINNLLNEGHVPNLFKGDDIMQLTEKMRSIAKREGLMDMANRDNILEFYAYFV